MEQRRSFNRPRGNGQGGGNQYQQRPRRNLLPEGFSLYYIAIDCPPAIEETVSGFKAYMGEKYGCKAAAKSAAHITVVPPFRAEDEMTSHLADFVHAFNSGMVPVEVNMTGYGQFGDRVLYINVEPTMALSNLEKEAMSEFSSQFPAIIFGMKPDFNPHVTIATRDIPEGRLAEARTYFESNHPFEASYEARDLTLYKLENGWWNKAS